MSDLAGFTRQAQAIGFTPAESHGMCELRAAGVSTCDDARRKLGDHLTMVQVGLAQRRHFEVTRDARLPWAERHPAPACEVG